MMRVGGVTVAHNFAINLRAAFFGVFQFFQHEHARAFAHDEAVAVFVERTGSGFRIVVARAHGAHRAKAAVADGNDSRFRTAGKHDLGVAGLDGAPGFADGVVRRRARRAGGEVRPAQIEIHRDEAGRHVADEHRDGERRHAPRPALEQDVMLFGRRGEAADAGADHRADFVAIFLGEFEAGIFQRTPCGIYGKMRIAVGAADFLGRGKRGCRIKIFHLAGDLRVERRRVKARNFVNATLAGDEALPERIEVVAQRRDDAHARDDDAAVGIVVCHDKIKRGSSGCVQPKLPRSSNFAYLAVSSTYLITSPTLWSFSACSSGTSMPNSSSSAITSSTVSSESAPRSSMNFACGVTCSGFTPSCSTTMSFTRWSIGLSAIK